MQKKIAISNWIFISKFFLQRKKNFEISILLIFTFGLFSNSAFAQLPLEDFGSGIPATWAITSNQTVTNNWVPTTPTGGYLGTPGAMVNPALNNTAGVTAEYYLISPQFSTTDITEIRFYTKQGSFVNKGTTYELRLSTANQPDISSFNVVLQSWTEAQLNVSATTYEEKIVTVPSIPAGIPVYIAFVAVTQQTGTSATSGDTWFVDNVRVISSCTPVTGITSTMTANGGVINWIHPTASNFQIQIVPHDAPYVPTGGIPVTGTSYNAIGLADGTTYDVYIRTICDATTGSSWAGPFPVTTAKLGLDCGTPIVVPTSITTTPYVLSTNLSTFHDPQNYTPLDSQGLSCQPFGSTQNWLSGDHAFLSYTPTTSGLVNISQAVNINYPSGCYNSLSSVFIFDSCAIGTTANCLGSLVTGEPSSVTSSQLQNIYMQAGQTYYFVISSPFQYYPDQDGASICFTFTLSAPSCPIPSGITYTNLTQTSATFSWDNPQNLVNAWEYIVKPVAQGAPTGSDVVTPTATNTNNSVINLTSATNYNVYVRSVCGGTPGGWSAAYAFRTPCDALTPPYYTGFDDDTMNNCWSQLNMNNDSDSFGFGPNGFSEPVAKLRTSNAENNTNDMLVSPQFHLDGVTQKRLRFKYNIYGNWGLIVNNPTGGPGSFEVKISTTGIGAQNFTTTVIPLTSYTTAYNFIEAIVPLPNITGDINIAWILPQGATQTGSWIYIDDVYVEDLPACSEPSYPVVTAGSITSTSAEVSWTNGYNNSQWELVAQPLGTGVPTTPGIIVNSNPYTLTGLDPSTRYEFYVRAYCSATLQSTWAGPINFNTLCIAQPTPYFESFNDVDPNTKKFCWSTNNVDGDPAEWRITGTEASIYPQPVNFFEPFSTYNDWLISAPVNVVGTKRLRFKYRVTTSPFFPSPRGNFEVLMSSTPDFSTYTTLIPTHNFSNGSFMEDAVLLTGTGTTYIAFRLPPGMANPSETGIVVIDDFVIEDAPACPNPSHLAVANITPTTANLNWTIGNTESQWQVVVQEAGSGIPTGSGTTVNAIPTYNATGLTPDTNYEYYVIAVCNATESSEWVGPFTFKTTCNPLATPFLETFDSNSNTESCWTVVNANEDGNSWNLNQPANPIFGDQMAALFTGMNGNNNDWLITPTLTAHAGQRLRFYYKVLDNFFEEDLKVMLSVNGVATNQFSLLYENNTVIPTDATGTVAGSDIITLTSTQGVQLGDRVDIPGWVIPYGSTVVAINGSAITISGNADITAAGPLNVTFVHETINNTQVREMVINLDDITTATNINIGFHTPYFPPNPWNYRGQYTFIDNVIVEDIPACPSVINAAVSTIMDTTAGINWEVVGSETTWEISVQPFGTPAPVGSTLPQYLQTTTAHPYTITGLAPSTKYQVYIRAVCSGSSQSEWVGPIEILTKCDLSNLCEYTISLSNGNTGQVYQGLDVVQNGVVLQTLEFPVDAPNQPTVLDHHVFLCSGIEFNLYWNGMGSGLQYSEAQAVIKDQSGTVVWTSPLGLGTINTDIYTGVSNCAAVTCPQPTDLAVSNLGVLSWTPGGSETQWEVFVQPLGQGSIPQSGTIVNTPNYTPVASDFYNPLAGTNEFFIRAICGSNDKSYWTGPKVFIRNDEPTTAIRLNVNPSEACVSQGVKASFIGATPSNVPTSCGSLNGGDIWYEFVAASKVQTIELSNFNPGSYYTSSFTGTWPKIMLSLYEVQPDGSLVEKACSENNSLVTVYSSELTVGTIYKIRVKYDGSATNEKQFDICVSTPSDICNMNAFNYSFEKLPMQHVTGITTIIDAVVVPGWRVNTDWGTMFFQEGSNSGDVSPYSGGQCLQLTQDGADAWDPNDPNIKGLYKDFDTSEIKVMDYSFASATRQTNGTGTTLQLFAGPPSGPFTVIAEDHADSLIWDLIKGSYTIPNGQTTTRFIFRVKENAIGHILDAANFKPNTDILTEDTTLPCTQTSLNVEAVGVGQWIADANNPGVTSIGDPASTATAISGFAVPGVYTYYWKTRYCDKVMTITYQGVTEVATVTTPVTYCINQVASPLTATAPAGYTLQWFTDPVVGTGDANAPIPSTTTVGTTTYYVALVDAGGCIGARTLIEVVVNPKITPVVGFGYDETQYCVAGNSPVITLDAGFSSGGAFTVNPTIGLLVDPVTGAVNVSNSTPGTYVITYNVAEDNATCNLGGTSNFTITIQEAPVVVIEDVCEDHMLLLKALPVNASFDPSTADYIWKDHNNLVIGTNADTLNVDEYLSQNPSVSLPLNFSVSITSGNCIAEASFTLENDPCKMIPRGISPNNDNSNDSFDLNGLDVKELLIYNRYGTEVYSFKGNYTNQWNGLSSSGEELPDATYFYSIRKANGNTVTGWVYINRQY
ncbi:choice-of-anchor J domain-containing protein [Flavobacterium sp.]|uniref:choice-of-anchor J domain-containing protein n=1 Tax=Flavobacterium sp. TaxID=239 RepID=UPI003D6A5F36